MQYWMELLGMVGGPVRVPCRELTPQDKEGMLADLAATGILERAAAARKRG